MSKGAVIAATVVGAAVILGGGAAFAATRKTPQLRGVSKPPPPPPPPGGAAAIAHALITSGGEAMQDTGAKIAVQLDSAKAQSASILRELVFGSSKICRGSNGKDVFPNDMIECAKLGAYTCEDCSRLFDLANHRWPWTRR